MIKETGHKKSPGYCSLNVKIIKIMANTNINVFVNSFNKIWDLGVYPDAWKITRVASIPKQGKDLSEPSSYRPICLLPIWAKVLDKVITKRLSNYLIINNILHTNQSGFRKNLNTIDALYRVKEIVENNMANNSVTCLISFDMSNAFNSVHVKDLCNTIDKYNVPIKIAKIMVSYLRSKK